MSKVHQILTDKVLAMIDGGVAPWKRPWRAAGRPRNIRGTNYHGINYFMLSMVAEMNGWSNVWMTFNQIKEKGGTIKEDQKKNGTCAYFFKMLERENAITGDMENSHPIFRFFLVFNLDQVDGIIVKGVNDQTGTVHAELPAPQSIVDGYQNAPEIRFGGGAAYYQPVTDKVTMPLLSAFHTAEQYYATMFHELAHSTGHLTRLNRKEIMDPVGYASHEYSLEELVAELTSVYLCDECGITNNRTLENSAAYLANWYSALKNDPKMFATAAARAQKAATHILGKVEDAAQED
jgi:antirestriction protein ArdC